MNSVAHGLEDAPFTDRSGQSRTLPEGKNRWVDTRERECRALRLQLLLNLDQDVGSVGVRQVDGLGIEDDARRRFLLPNELVHARAEPVGVREEERPVDSGDDDPRDPAPGPRGARRRGTCPTSDRARGA